MAADGTVRGDGQNLADREALEQRLREVAALADPPELRLQAEDQAPYGQVAMILSSARQDGLRKIGLTGGPAP